MRRTTTASEDGGEEEEHQPQVGTTFYDYQAREQDELSFQRGSVVEVIDKDRQAPMLCVLIMIIGFREKGWAFCKIGEKTGLVPENYVSLLGRRPRTIRTDQVTLGEGVGEGSFCKVFKGRFHGQDVALKIPKIQGGKMEEILDCE